MRYRAPAVALVGVLALGGLTACSDDEQQDVRQQLDETGQQIQDGAEDATDRIEEEVDEATNEN